MSQPLISSRILLDTAVAFGRFTIGITAQSEHTIFIVDADYTATVQIEVPDESGCLLRFNEIKVVLIGSDQLAGSGGGGEHSTPRAIRRWR